MDVGHNDIKTRDDGVGRRRERFKARILLPFTLLLVFMLGAFILAAYRDEEREYRRNLSESVQTVERLFIEELEKESLMMRSLVETIIHNEEVKAAYLSRHRDALYRHALPLFEELREDFDVTHLYFTDADRVNFLRVHAPDRHGDVIDRGTTLRAKETGKTASGVELGPLGTLTLRVVVPWREEGKVVGFVELGHEIWHFALDMNRVLGVGMLLLDYKKYLDRGGWEQGMRIMGHRADWDRFPTTVAVDWTMDALPIGLIEIMERRRHPHMPEMTLLDQEEDGRILIAAFLPIFERFGREGEEYSPGREVGDFAIIRDVTGIHAAFLKSVVWTVALSLLAGGVVFALFYVILGRVEGDVRRHAEALSDEIAERKRAEENLLKLSTAVEQSPATVVITDTHGTIEYVNPKFVETTGYTSEEAIGQNINILKSGLRPPEYYKDLWETITSGNEWRGEFHNKKKNGELYWESASISPIKSPEGEITHFLAVKEDITERRAMEDQLRQSLKMEAVGQLTGGVAHDFNNLLAVIEGNLELLEEKLEGEEKLRDFARRAIGAVERGAALTQRLLAFSRKQALKPEVIDLDRLVLGMRDLLQRTLGETIKIKTASAGDLWKCEVDPAQMENVLLNLAINARDAMPKGGKLTIETGNAQLGDDYAAAYPDLASGDYVLLAVSDTGEGMPQEVMERVFEPFFTTKETGKGSGLGLSMVYGFVKQSGGHVTIYSEKGKGTTVKIYFPRIMEEAESRENKVESREIPLARGETVLVVEDDPEVLTLAGTLLGDLGYKVLEAKDGKSALAKLEDKQRIDLLLTDVVLGGGMDGPDLAEEVRHHRRGMKVLYMSGYTERAIPHLGPHPGRKDGEIHLLQKPFHKAELARMVRQMLDGEVA